MERTRGLTPISPPPLPARKNTKAKGSRRREGCTHLTMTRVYDQHGSQKCEMCDRVGSMGWLYRCTQDYNGFLPSDSVSSEHSHNHPDLRPSQDPALDRLSPCLTKAIEEGHYSDDQVMRLKEQKMGVKARVIAAEQENSEIHHQHRGPQKRGHQRRSLPSCPLLEKAIAPPPRLSFESALSRASLAQSAVDALQTQSKTALQNAIKPSAKQDASEVHSLPDNACSSSSDRSRCKTLFQTCSTTVPNRGESKPVSQTEVSDGTGHDAPQSATEERSTHPCQANPEEGLDAWRRYYDELEDAFKDGKLSSVSSANDTTDPMPSSSSAAEYHVPQTESLMSQLQNTNIAIAMTPESTRDPEPVQHPEVCKHLDCQPYNSMHPKCNYSVCPACRQSFRDRTFISLNEALVDGPSNLPIVAPWELLNRPSSPAHTVRFLGLPTTARQVGITKVSSRPTDIAGNPSTHARVQRIEELRQSLRVSRNMLTQIPYKVKNVIARRTQPAQDNSASDSGEASRATGDAASQRSRSGICQRKREKATTRSSTEEQADNEVDELWEAAWHRVAVGTPLPESSSSDKDSHSSSEVEVAGGVAVTEEGVTLLHPDIIMQA